ncbi:GAF domain-containing protein [Cytophagaceae bacterium ABcell3]|nr:GAF domain-containing protein [Cytophagaceae bacterium ABcell3]
MKLPINKDYDSEVCGSLPLHLVNHVQSYGFLLVLDYKEFKVVQCSENSSEFLNVDIDGILGKPIEKLFSEGAFKEFYTKIEQRGSNDSIPFKTSLNGNDGSGFICNMTIHFKEKYFLLEIEPDSEVNNKSFSDVHRDLKYILSSLKKGKDLEELTAIAAREIRKFAGLDKVMIYQFDENWNGFVLAEDKIDSLESYLYLWFPASDVPRPARELYLRNPYRLIPDRGFRPSKLMPVVNPLINSFTDISDCNLRGVVAVHLEYLKNMNVQASMSLPIIVNGKLWGLISCHHQTACELSYEMRAVFELLADILSSQISAIEKEKELSQMAIMSEKLAGIIEKLYSVDNIASALLNEDTDILNLFGLDGVAIVIEGVTSAVGNVPGQKDINGVVHWLQRENIDKVFTTSSLVEYHYESIDYADIASGLLAIPISLRDGSYILGFRPEVVQNVRWGGNPEERVQMEKDGINYHPRSSFSVWQETVKHTSEPWSSREIEIAEKLRVAILEKLVNV